MGSATLLNQHHIKFVLRMLKIWQGKIITPCHKDFSVMFLLLKDWRWWWWWWEISNTNSGLLKMYIEFLSKLKKYGGLALLRREWTQTRENSIGTQTQNLPKIWFAWEGSNRVERKKNKTLICKKVHFGVCSPCLSRYVSYVCFSLSLHCVNMLNLLFSFDFTEKWL